MKTERSLDLVGSATLIAALAGVPAAAHHSITYFDLDAEVRHENVRVIDFQVANPHGLLVYVVTNEGGDEEEWHAELPSANFMRRGGMDESILRPGDELTVVVGQPGVPGRTRDRLMRLTRAEFPNGDFATLTSISVTFVRSQTQ